MILHAANRRGQIWAAVSITNDYKSATIYKQLKPLMGAPTAGRALFIGRITDSDLQTIMHSRHSMQRWVEAND